MAARYARLWSTSEKTLADRSQVPLEMMQNEKENETENIKSIYVHNICRIYKDYKDHKSLRKLKSNEAPRRFAPYYILMFVAFPFAAKQWTMSCLSLI